MSQLISHKTRSKPKLKVQQPVEQPIAHRTRVRVKNAKDDVVKAIVSGLLAVSVMHQETGQMLEFRQLGRHQKYNNKIGTLPTQMSWVLCVKGSKRRWKIQLNNGQRVWTRSV
jgi:hypothetical protein